MSIINFTLLFRFLPLPTQHLDMGTIGDHYIVTAVSGRVEDGLVLAHEQLGDGDGHSADGNVGGVDVVPEAAVRQSCLQCNIICSGSDGWYGSIIGRHQFIQYICIIKLYNSTKLTA